MTGEGWETGSLCGRASACLVHAAAVSLGLRAILVGEVGEAVLGPGTLCLHPGFRPQKSPVPTCVSGSNACALPVLPLF